MGALIGSLPSWLQMLYLSYGIISGISLTIVFTIRSSVDAKTDMSKKLLINGPREKDKKKRFPGTRTKIGSMDIVPKKELDDLKRQEQEKKSALRPLEEENRQVQRHATDAKNQAAVVEGVLKRYQGSQEDGKALEKELGLDAPAATPDGPGLVVVRGNNQAGALRAARQSPLPEAPGRNRGARPSP